MRCNQLRTYLQVRNVDGCIKESCCRHRAYPGVAVEEAYRNDVRNRQVTAVDNIKECFDSHIAANGRRDNHGRRIDAIPVTIDPGVCRIIAGKRQVGRRESWAAVGIQLRHLVHEEIQRPLRPRQSVGTRRIAEDQTRIELRERQRQVVVDVGYIIRMLVPHFPGWQPGIRIRVEDAGLTQALLLDGIAGQRRVVRVAGHTDIGTSVTIYIGYDGAFRERMRPTNSRPYLCSTGLPIDNGEFQRITVDHLGFAVVIKIVNSKSDDSGLAVINGSHPQLRQVARAVQGHTEQLVPRNEQGVQLTVAVGITKIDAARSPCPAGSGRCSIRRLECLNSVILHIPIEYRCNRICAGCCLIAGAVYCSRHPHIQESVTIEVGRARRTGLVNSIFSVGKRRGTVVVPFRVIGHTQRIHVLGDREGHKGSSGQAGYIIYNGAADEFQFLVAKNVGCHGARVHGAVPVAAAVSQEYARFSGINPVP